MFQSNLAYCFQAKVDYRISSFTTDSVQLFYSLSISQYQVVC